MRIFVAIVAAVTLLGLFALVIGLVAGISGVLAAEPTCEVTLTEAVEQTNVHRPPPALPLTPYIQLHNTREARWLLRQLGASQEVVALAERVDIYADAPMYKRLGVFVSDAKGCARVGTRLINPILYRLGMLRHEGVFGDED